MARVYFERGIKAGDLEKGVEFEVDHEEESSESDDDFYDKRFDDIKREIIDIGMQMKDLLLPFDKLRELMQPITEDGLVMKQILKWGYSGNIPDKSVVVLHYDAFLENQKTPFDSTRQRNRPYKFLLGEGNMIPGLEVAIKTMKRGEISKCLVHPTYAYGEMGCPPRIPGNAEILYIAEILNVYESKDVIEFEEMTPEEQKKASFEKISAVFHCDHQMANELFKGGQYKPAIARYRRLVKLLEDVSVADEVQDEKRKEYLLKLYLNLALCYIHVKNSSKAIIYADLALKLDGKNPKALYRMGYALFLADDFDRARYYLNRAKQFKPYENSINRTLIDLDQKQKQHKQWENMFCKRMFGNNTNSDTGFSETTEVKDFREVIDKQIKKFMDSEDKEQQFSSGYTEWQVDIVKELAREYNLAFVSKIQMDTKIIKVAKKS